MAPLDEPLADRVERAGRLVEDEDARVLEQHAGQRDALLLAARQLVAALADDRVVALGQLRMRSWMAARRAAAWSSRSVASGLRVSEVLAHGAWNRYVSWVTKPMTSPRLARRDLAHVDAVDLDRARRPRRTAAARGRSSSSCPSPTARRAPRAGRARPRSRCPRARTACASAAGRARRRVGVGRSTSAIASGTSALAPCAAASGARRRPSAAALVGPDSGTRRGGSGSRRAPASGSRATASGRVDDRPARSRYSKMRSNRASAPWTSTWTLSSWPSGKKRRDWSVVKATMSPIVGAVGSPWMASQPASQ